MWGVALGRYANGCNGSQQKQISSERNPGLTGMKFSEIKLGSVRNWMVKSFFMWGVALGRYANGCNGFAVR